MLMTSAPAPPSAFSDANHWRPAMTLELRQDPAPLQTLAPARDAPGAMPGSRPSCPGTSAAPAAMPDTWVPWPLSSYAGDGEHDWPPFSPTTGRTAMQLTKALSL